jgi:hypothetical protein
MTEGYIEGDEGELLGYLDKYKLKARLKKFHNYCMSLAGEDERRFRKFLLLNAGRNGMGTSVNADATVSCRWSVSLLTTHKIQ